MTSTSEPGASFLSLSITLFESGEAVFGYNTVVPFYSPGLIWAPAGAAKARRRRAKQVSIVDS